MPTSTLPTSPLLATYYYLSSITHHLTNSGTSTLSTSPHSKSLPMSSNIYLYQIALNWFLWDKKHYRKDTYVQDLRDNLSNVAIPGTGVPLSYFVFNKALFLFFIYAITPLIALLSSFNLLFVKKTHNYNEACNDYIQTLLNPMDWFTLWRVNSTFTAYHSYLTNTSPGYEMENKWSFLTKGESLNVPVSPFLKAPNLVLKHRNIEGGMGIHFYENACVGGDWIIQERINNSEYVQSILPDNAPLSTFRVITASKNAFNVTSSGAFSQLKQPTKSNITAMSCVFRAGRQNAKTDHDCILFNIDTLTGEILGGSTNANWYKLGLHHALPGGCPWRSGDEEHVVTVHPDNTKLNLKGTVIPNMQKMLDLCIESHLKICSDVPFVGWDVVLSSDERVPMCFLEVNLSCNFFRGKFEEKKYWLWLEEGFGKMDVLREKGGGGKGGGQNQNQKSD